MQRTFFSPESVFWRVNRELATGLAGPRAVLMQIAHPLIAAGVAEHSNFRSHRIGRLYRTSLAAAGITFGSRKFALRLIHFINQKHRKVHGVLHAPAGPFPGGTPYDANDPELKLWVMSTITDSILALYDAFVARLSLAEREDYYRDSLLGTRLFGIPDRITPPNYAEFVAYMQRMLESGVITVSDDAREIAQNLFSSFLGDVFFTGSTIGIGLLPERLRQEFGFEWTARRERWLTRGAFISRRLRKRVPRLLCSSPFATVAELQAMWTRSKNSPGDDIQAVGTGYRIAPQKDAP